MQITVAPDRIGVAGHSLGGWTAFAIAGVEVHCERPEDIEPVSGGEVVKKFPSLCESDFFKGKSTSLRDPRVKAVLGLSPSVWAFPNNRGEVDLELPSMIITGEKKEVYMKYSAAFFSAFLKDDEAAREYIGEAHYKRVMLRADGGGGQ